MKKAKELSLDRLIELVEDNLPDPRRLEGTYGINWWICW